MCQHVPEEARNLLASKRCLCGSAVIEQSSGKLPISVTKETGNMAYHRGALLKRRPRCRPLEVSALEDRVLLSGPGATTAPTTIASVISGHLGTNNFYTTPVTIKLAATDPDDASSTLTTIFSVNGGAFVQGNAVTISQNGTDTLSYFSKDPTGNTETTKTFTVNIDTTVPVVTIATVNPTVLWPPNHKFVPVTVTGSVTDASGGVPSSVSFNVVDEYGEVQPSGTAPVNSAGNFSFTVSLPASRLGQDKDGRLFTIMVSATDQAGNTSSTSTNVIVPHDMGHRFNGGAPISSGGTPSFPGTGTGTASGSHGHHHHSSSQHLHHSLRHSRHGMTTTTPVFATVPGGGGDGGGDNGDHGHGHGHGGENGNDNGQGNDNGHGHGNGNGNDNGQGNDNGNG
jgi:hypothetical protein